MLDGFDARKAAHAAAYFTRQYGGAVSTARIGNLLYLTDRCSLEHFDLPILFDRYISLPSGPTGLVTFEYLRDARSNTAWGDMFADDAPKGERREIALRRQVALDDLDYLSEDDVELMRSVWRETCEFAEREFLAYLRTTCPEWDWSKNPGDVHEISYENMFKALGKRNIEMLADHVEAARALSFGMQDLEQHSSSSWNAPHPVGPAA